MLDLIEFLYYDYTRKKATLNLINTQSDLIRTRTVNNNDDVSAESIYYHRATYPFRIFKSG